MFSFKRRSRDVRFRPVGAGIEQLEPRAYLSATPATIAVTVPGPIPGSEIAGVVVNDRIGVNISDNDVVKAHGKATIALFASVDQTLSSDDAQLQDASVVPVNIAPGRNHTFKIRVKSFPQNLNGTYYILAEVTGTGVNPAIASSTSTIAIEQAEIDLANTAVSAPLNGHAGHHIPVTVHLTNDGNIPAKGPLAVAFSLSATQDGASPVSLATLTRHINLKPGVSTVLHFSVPLALGIPTGNEYVVVNLDPSDAFLDSNLANNILVDQQPITIT